jgi:hypothetical protein
MSEGMPHGGHGDLDATGKKVGVLAAILAVGLTIVTIASHRSHTHAIVARSEANDQWAYFQSKKLKSHGLELGIDLITAQGLKGAAADRVLEKYASERDRYDKETKEIKLEAEAKDREYRHAEHRGVRFDLAEGLFEIGLVMSSLYFLARKKLFPAFGLLAGLAGAVLGVLGTLA